MGRHVVVIGAGAVGVMCALECRAAGLDVTLVDAGDPGGEQAASYGNAGWFSSQSILPPAEPGVWRKLPGYLADPLGPLAIRPLHLPRVAPWLLRYAASTRTHERVARIAGELRTLLHGAAQLHHRVAQGAGLSHLIRPDSGLMHVYRSRQQFLLEHRAWQLRERAGIPWRELGEQELRTMQPHLSHDYRHALVVPEGGHCVNPGAYVAGLARHAVERGVRLLRAHATGWRFDGTRLAAVRLAAQDELPCDAAVVAAGAFSRPLAREVGTKAPLETERGYHVEHLAPNVAPSLPIMVADRKLIVTRTLQGLRIAGQVELAGLRATPDWRRADVLQTLLHRLFPALHDLGPAGIRRWMGHRPSSPDGKPYIGASRRCADVILAYGHGHIGLGSSARTGRLVAQLLTGQAPDIDLAPFSPHRHQGT